VTAEIAVTLVIGQDNHNVGTRPFIVLLVMEAIVQETGDEHDEKNKDETDTRRDAFHSWQPRT
jgi:hypothetical protein